MYITRSRFIIIIMDFFNTGNLWNVDADTGVTTIALPVLSYMRAIKTLEM